MIVISQQDREPLERISEVLRTELDITKCPIAKARTEYQIQLGVEASAKFVRAFKERVKTKKARRDLEEAEILLARPRRLWQPEARRAIGVLGFAVRRT